MCRFQPNPGCGNNSGKRWPYSASFQLPTAFYDQSAIGNRIAQASTHVFFLVPGGVVFGAETLAGVPFPSNKVHVHDSHARHFGQVKYCVVNGAQSPMLFVDGAVRVVNASESNPGWQPNSPTSALPSGFNYEPAAWEPPTSTGFPSEPVIGRFRWTRGFEDGRDVKGPEACTGQPGCN
jgi:hypothetical protein